MRSLEREACQASGGLGPAVRTLLDPARHGPSRGHKVQSELTELEQKRTGLS
jgi:hypothetical protein